MTRPRLVPPPNPAETPPRYSFKRDDKLTEAGISPGALRPRVSPFAEKPAENLRGSCRALFLTCLRLHISRARKPMGE